MSDYFKSKVFGPLSEGKIDKAYLGYRQLQQINATPQWDVYQPDPLKEDAKNFLKAFRLEVSRETKKAQAEVLQRERDIALKRIEEFVDDQMSSSCKAFPLVNAYRYAIDLALRVRRPRIIDQRETALCGPVAIMCAFFKTDPKAATEFALSLVENGSGDLRQYKIDSPDHLKNKRPPDRFKMAPVDWLLLTSLRYHFEPLAAMLGRLTSKESVDSLRQLTKPGLLTALLREMGYKEVIDRTFGFETFPAVAKIADALTRYPLHGSSGTLRGKANLDRAELDLDRGMLVFLLAYGDMEGEAKVRRKSRSFPKVDKELTPSYDDMGFPVLHWTLVRKLTVAAGYVSIRIYSYGRAREATFPLEQFLKIYFGYVMANPF